MGIFRRARRTDEPEEPHEDDLVARDEASAHGPDEDEDIERDEATAADDDEDAAEDEYFSRARGPFDAAEVDDDLDRVDLGALKVAPVDGLQLRLELDQAQENVVSAQAVLGGSSVQLEAYAAPRTSGVWPEIRAEIAESIAAQGGSAQVVDGPLGRELVASIPSRGANGQSVQNRVRFLGVDGPRWFLRAVISGPAALDEARAEPLVELVRNVVVVRDDQARPPREALPLRVPETPAADAPAGSDAEPGSGRRSADDLTPFQRGPEITEVR